ncbi:MAG: protein TolR [Gammaproteobacteria bacterium]|nr:protein TolR [Gammaproteobacteria bacterium]
MYHRRKKRLMSEINVVPYIDVMLVLMIIFMVTAPLLTQGVKVDMVQAVSDPVPTQDSEPFLVTVDKQGDYFVNDDTQATTLSELGVKAAAVKRRRQETEFLVRGDKAVAYEAVIKAMAVLQQVGVKSVGLVTEPPEK